ncbi:MAG: hypothetical protein AB2541_02585, partial [Candidatus Thiodiazotropha sp.]
AVPALARQTPLSIANTSLDLFISSWAPLFDYLKTAIEGRNCRYDSEHSLLHKNYIALGVGEIAITMPL